MMMEHKKSDFIWPTKANVIIHMRDVRYCLSYRCENNSWSQLGWIMWPCSDATQTHTHTHTRKTHIPRPITVSCLIGWGLEGVIKYKALTSARHYWARAVLICPYDDSGPYRHCLCVCVCVCVCAWLPTAAVTSGFTPRIMPVYN